MQIDQNDMKKKETIKGRNVIWN